MNCPLRINQTFLIWRGARFVDIMLVRWKPLGSKKWAFKWFHTLLFLLKNRLSYRSFISTWRKSTTIVHGVSYSQTLSNSFCTLTDVFLYCTLSDAFFYPTNSILLDIIRHTVLFFTYSWHTISHCSSIGVWRYSQKYLTLKDVWRFDNNAPFFSTSCIKAIKKCRSSQAKYRQIT